MLWQKTHLLKLQDIECIYKYQLTSENDWLSLLQNQKLKEYLSYRTHWLTEVKLQMDTLQKENIKVCHYYSEDYPKPFKNMDTPPLFLSYRGDLKSLNLPCLSIVGTRDPSQDACKWMETYLYQVVKGHRFTVISGAAMGIDRYAHSIANICKRPTIAILPSGIANIYPKVFESEVEEVLSNGGALISEYECYQTMQKHHFYQRNRLIAALGNLLLVVEAKRKSGSLITAKYAMSMGKDILVLPSSPLDTDKLGTLDLLFDGAFPVRDDLDLLSYLAPYLTKSIKGYNDKDAVSHP